MDAFLTKLGFKDFTHFQSGTEEYPKCLSKATQDVLRQNIDTPIFLIEDDLEFTGHDTFDWDVTADAIYFGNSQYGHEFSSDIQSVVHPYNEAMVKVYSMFATHAILYISPEYKLAVIEALNDTSIANDVIIARLHKKFNVYAMKKPAFWQSALFNHAHQENSTKLEFYTTIHKVALADHEMRPYEPVKNNVCRLQDFKTVYICPNHNDKYKARKVYMDDLLTKLGFTNFSHYQSGNEDYPKCLANAFQTILKQNMDNPVLILEDDLEYTGFGSFQWDPTADAIYFGSLTDGEDKQHSKLNEYSCDMIRLQSMLSAHAVLYITKEHKQAVIDALDDTTTPPDMHFSRLFRKFNVYAPMFPTFWQSAKFNIQIIEDHTKFFYELRTNRRPLLLTQ